MTSHLGNVIIGIFKNGGSSSSSSLQICYFATFLSRAEVAKLELLAGYYCIELVNMTQNSTQKQNPVIHTAWQKVTKARAGKY